MDPDVLAVRRRLRDDFPFYAEKALKIRSKELDIRPLILNRSQRSLSDTIARQMASEGRVRIIILKARQLGLSTAIGGRIYQQITHRKGAKAIVITHDADATANLLDMTKRYHEHCPPILKPATKYLSARKIYFDGLDSGYAVATAGGESIGRSQTFTHAHLSELAFWPKSSAASNFNGLMQAVPKSEGTEVYIESTANGISGLFYDQWLAATKGISGFIPVFIPWFYDDQYRETVPVGFVRSPEEERLILVHGDDGLVDDEQLQFRRIKIATGGIDLFRQEYPGTAEEAFLTSGRPVFNPAHLARFGDGVKTPAAQLALEGDEWVPHPRGELLVYRPREPGTAYYIGADVGLGVKRDWSVCQILDNQKRQCATWRGQADPAYFAEIINSLGIEWNQAMVAVEANNMGVLTNYRLSREFNYAPLWQETTVDKTTDRETERVGFLTTSKTKPMIINELRAEFRLEEIEVYDPQTLAELRSYIVTETGSMEAERGLHDDCVIALAIASHTNDGAWVPLVVTDDHYVSFD